MKRFRSGSTSPSKVDSGKCASCKEVADEDVLECSWCEHRVHRGCTKISPSQCAVLGEVVSNVLFFCSPCEHKLPIALSCYDATNEVQCAVDSKLTAMELALSDKINSLSNQLKELDATHSTNRPMETTLESQTATSLAPRPDSSVTALSIADELSDRERRRKNLVLYKVPEGTNIQSDKDFFKDFCKTVYNLKVATTRVFRLGNKKGNNGANEQPQPQSQPRPLLVSLEKESDRDTLLTRSGQIRHYDKYKEIYIAPDKTKFERAKHKKLVEELKQRRARGESNLIIRNGNIVSKRSRSHSTTNTDQPGSNTVQDQLSNRGPSDSSDSTRSA